MKRFGPAVLILSFLSVTGCQTTKGHKPLLTASASRKIAAHCGASVSEFHRGGASSLPYADFKVPPGEPASDDGLSPTLKCLYNGLNGYRRAMLAWVPDDAE